LLLRAPRSGRSTHESVINGSTTGQTVEDHSPSSETITQSETESVESPPTLTILEKFRIIPSLLVYMVPLGLVYLFEYFINQGLVSRMKLRAVRRFHYCWSVNSSHMGRYTMWSDMWWRWVQQVPLVQLWH